MTFCGRKSLKKRGRKQNRTYKRGGKFIGMGAYGCTFRPALLCKGDTARRRDTVSKLMMKNETELEYSQTQILEEVDPYGEFFIRPTTLCEPYVPFPAEDKVEDCKIRDTEVAPWFAKGNTWDALSARHRILQMPDGGYDLNNVKFSLETVIPLFNSLAYLFEGLLKAHSRNITHNDIKLGNIVVGEYNGVIRSRFIDFGFLFRTTDLVEIAKDPDGGFYNYGIFSNDYRVWSPDVRLADPYYIQTVDVNHNWDRSNRKENTISDNPEKNFPNSILQPIINNYYRTIDSQFPQIETMYFYNDAKEKMPVITPKFMRLLNSKFKRMRIKDRHTFIFKQNDVFGLGVVLLDMLHKLTKVCAKHSVELMRLLYDKLYAPFKILIKIMTMPDPFERIGLDSAFDKYRREILPIINELFSAYFEPPSAPKPPILPSLPPVVRRNTPIAVSPSHTNLITLNPSTLSPME